MNEQKLQSEVKAAAEGAVQEATQSIQHGLDEAHAYLKRQWNERPLTVAAVAVGLGALIGLAMSRKS